MANTIKKHIKDPGSAITHFIGMLMAAFASVPLIIKAAHEPGRIYIISIIIYATSLILLYAASTTYHTFNKSKKINTILKKIDHMMISVLIAGSYTPICLLVLKGRLGISLLAIVWSFAIAGIIIKAFWVNCPKWVSSVLYIGMGWTCVLAFTQLLNSMSSAAFGWLLAGGIIYTIGGVIYALKLSLFNTKHQYFGSHEIFHLFVMGGSACHFVVMYAFILQLRHILNANVWTRLYLVKPYRIYCHPTVSDAAASLTDNNAATVQAVWLNQIHCRYYISTAYVFFFIQKHSSIPSSDSLSLSCSAF